MQSIIKKIVWFCLLAIPFVVLHVADAGLFDPIGWFGSGLFFPFISGKNLLFRFFVEIALAGWVILALRDASYRINLKKSPLTVAYGVFVVILLLADIFGVDQGKSIWSNFERMEGFVGHIHLFAYFFVLTAMVSTLKDWQKMWKYFIASNILVLIYAYGQLLGAKGTFIAEKLPKMAEWFSVRFPIHMSSNRLDATIGNSAYFAVFCLVFIFIAALLWSQRTTKKYSWFYPAVIILNIIGLFYSGTRGTMIGFIVGGFVTLGLVALKEKGHMRKVLAGTMLAAALFVGSIFIFKDTAFIKTSPTLSRLASISPNDITGASRISMWKISYEAWLERPILGYGQDNFSYIFARKFLPERMCNLEPWYDRSHDVFFDWLVAGGALGLLSYLSLYGIALWVMWRKENHVPLREKAILTGAIVGYFIHNIFVFDNLTSYILFAALLAYIVIRTQGDNAHHNGKALVSDEQAKLLWIPLIVIVLFVTQYYINYRPIIVNQLVIKGMSIGQYAKTMPFADAVKIAQDSFTQAIAFNTLGSEEAREQFLQMAVRVGQLTIPPETPAAEKQATVQAVNNLLQAARKDITDSLPAHKEDVRMLSIYAMFYNGIGDAASAEQILILARTHAPKKQLLGFDLVRSLLIQKKYAEAYALGREVYDMSITCNDAQKWYLISAAYAGAYKEAVKDVLSRGQKPPLDTDVLSGLIATGQTGLVVEILQEAKKTNPELAAQIDAYIAQVLAPKK